MTRCPAPSASTAIAATTRRVDAAGEAERSPSGSRSCARSRAGPSTSAARPRPRRRAGRRSAGRRLAAGPARRRRPATRARRSASRRVDRVGGVAARRRAAGRSRSSDEQLLGELRGPGEQLAVGGHDDRVAVEDQLVLAADHVDVGQGRARPRRARRAHQRQPDVVLVQLVRRAVDDRRTSPTPACRGRRDRAAVLPEVLADGQRDVDAARPGPRSACRRARSSGTRRRRRSWAGGA